MTEQHQRIAAVVVLYHPSADLPELVYGLLGQVNAVYLVDNSVPPASEVVMPLLQTDAIVYLPNNANLGIAAALNIAAQRAEREGYAFLLTMDQDSFTSADMVERMLHCLDADDNRPLGILAPFQVTPAQIPSVDDPACCEVMTPMTSGCLLDLAAYRAVGPFRDDFFIDFVDNEYCLRLKRAGYRVIRANRAVLQHQIGDIRTYGPFVATNHGPLRRYYKTRNRLYVFVEYLTSFPGHCLFDLVRLAKEIGSILLFEEQKSAKLQMMLIGVYHFLRGRRGSYEEACRP